MMDEGHTADDIYLAKDVYSVKSRYLSAIMKSFGQGDVVVEPCKNLVKRNFSI